MRVASFLLAPVTVHVPIVAADVLILCTLLRLCLRGRPDPGDGGFVVIGREEILGFSDAGSTHAWAEVYVPGAGWITFDPTNRSVGGFSLIPVGVARNIRQAMQITGSFAGPNDAFSGNVRVGHCHVTEQKCTRLVC